MGRKEKGCCAPFAGGGSWVPVKHNVAWAKVYFRTRWRLHPSSRLAIVDMHRKLEAVPLLGGAATPSKTTSPGPRFTSIPSGILIHPAIWPQQTWAENWEAVPLRERGAGSPTNTMWPGPRPTCVPSFILIHRTVWPQYTNVTDRQTGQDRQRSDSIGRTVLQTVAQKSIKI